MSRDNRLFPELAPGAPLGWYRYLFSDGSMSLDPARAIAARRAGQSVQLIPRDMRAYYWLRPELGHVAPVEALRAGAHLAV